MTAAIQWAPSPVPGWSAAWTPRPKFTVSEWADAERLLPETSAARGARWRTEHTPYLRAIMDSIVDPDARKIVLMKAAQTGGTEAAMNMIGFLIAHEPTAMLYVLPTFDDAKKFSKLKLADMFRTTPALRAAVHDRRMAKGDKRSESTVLMKQFAGGSLTLGGAGTPNTFAMMSVRIAFGDDLDRWEALEEGDPADLLMNRVRTFHDGRAVYISTPTFKGAPIDSLYSRSDQRRYFLTCPNCQIADYTTWSDKEHFSVRYENDDPKTARLVCGHCKAEHSEMVRRQMVATGEWRPTRKSDEPGLIGYHLPAMISTLGVVTLSDLVSGWISAQGRREALRAFINTSLAEAWDDPSDSLSIEPKGGFMSARELYDTIPSAACLVTGAMDVQDDRFELLFVAWGPREECWVLEHIVLRADDEDPSRQYDPHNKQDWQRLYVELFGDPATGNPGLKFEHESGVMIPVSTLAVDSGFLTPAAYHFTRFNRSVLYATKGMKTLDDGHLIKFSQDKEAAQRTGVTLVLVNTSDCKQRVADRISDGRLHFPTADFCNEEFFAQLTAEEAKPLFSPKGVRIGQKWQKVRPRNEILDLLVLNIAARQIRGTWDLAEYRKKVGIQ